MDLPEIMERKNNFRNIICPIGITIKQDCNNIAIKIGKDLRIAINVGLNPGIFLRSSGSVLLIIFMKK
ncbi:MAG: hypothetical protein IPJ74_24375 [Saprospiraceae bacterium]|nr:hypothetical protein [Saprospiraceae bacterium]